MKELMKKIVESGLKYFITLDNGETFGVANLANIGPFLRSCYPTCTIVDSGESLDKLNDLSNKDNKTLSETYEYALAMEYKDGLISVFLDYTNNQEYVEDKYKTCLFNLNFRPVNEERDFEYVILKRKITTEIIRKPAL